MPPRAPASLHSSTVTWPHKVRVVAQEVGRSQCFALVCQVVRCPAVVLTHLMHTGALCVYVRVCLLCRALVSQGTCWGSSQVGVGLKGLALRVDRA